MIVFLTNNSILSVNYYDSYDYFSTFAATGDSLAYRTMDPLSEKYYSISPYAWCAGNPILFVDPNGMDTWKLDKQGTVIEIHNHKDYDSFQIVDEDGSIIESTQYSYGTIRKVNDNNVASYEVQESGNGEQLFRFLATNSNVEWGQIKTSKGENSSDFLLCSKDSRSVAITTDYITEHCAGRMINEINHSHPDGVETPTGLMEGVTGDIQAASSICRNLGYAPKFSIFSPISGNRVPFSPNSSSSDFPGADKGEVSISMREFTKTAPSLFKRETLLNHLRLHLP